MGSTSDPVTARAPPPGGGTMGPMPGVVGAGLTVDGGVVGDGGGVVGDDGGVVGDGGGLVGDAAVPQANQWLICAGLPLDTSGAWRSVRTSPT